jgi:hypothetical protein
VWVIEQNEMGRACSVYAKERDVYWVLVGKLRERANWVDPNIDDRLIFIWKLRKLERWWGLDRVGLG